MPPEIQDGASNGYYNRAALDGSRPAIYFINLKDLGDWPKYHPSDALLSRGRSRAITCRSASRSNRPTSQRCRKLGFFSAYSEGWALYAEQLADELGVYANDPLGRAVSCSPSCSAQRGWLSTLGSIRTRVGAASRPRTTWWQTTGYARPRSQREVERYCTTIGQACSYKVGHTAWIRARAEAQKTLGPKFDIKQFHEVLREGAMPLSILERRIRERTAAFAGAATPLAAPERG